VIASSEGVPTRLRVLAFSLSIILVPTGALLAVIALATEEVQPCPSLAVGAQPIPICPSAEPGGLTMTLPPAPSAPPPLSPVSSLPLPASVCALTGDADGYCKVGYKGDYVGTLGMLAIFCHYMLVYTRLSTVATASLVSSAIAIGWIMTAQFYLVFPRSDGDGGGQSASGRSRYSDVGWGLPEIAPLLLWWLLAHAIGLLHYHLRYNNLFQSHLLRKRHHRLLASIREETEHCERLLKNILPPHVLVHLSGMLIHADHMAKGNLTASKTIAERYQDCSFLFAKIGGLSKLINDSSIDPADMMGVLQQMFDRFDALADMFGVQKVRKTANEYYLVAAGLPNQDILPTSEDRACGIAGFGFAMINIMNIINLELQEYGINFTCQVGIHSGSAIAGIIGHKTFQYDLCGDAVNTAARMCSYSKPGHVNISETTYQIIKHKYGAVPRGELQIKGKGKMHTYFLLNMPVEQQEALQMLAAEAQQAPTPIIPLVDRWARRTKDHGSSNSPLKPKAKADEGATLVTNAVAAVSQGVAESARNIMGNMRMVVGGGSMQPPPKQQCATPDSMGDSSQKPLDALEV
jgi:class 3 adenylate cyclase